jgi:hypothetical protein
VIPVPPATIPTCLTTGNSLRLYSNSPLPLYCLLGIRQHTSAYVSIRQHTSAYVSIRQHTSAYVSIIPCECTQTTRYPYTVSFSRCQHTSAYVSIRQHTSAYVSIRQHNSLRMYSNSPLPLYCLLLSMSAYVSIRQHTPLASCTL